MHDARPPAAPAPARWRQRGLGSAAWRVAAWLSGAAAAFIGLVLFEAHRAGLPTSAAPGLPYLFASGVLLGLASGVVATVLSALGRRLRALPGAALGSAALALALVPFFWPVADELASGDGVVRRGAVEVVRWGAFAALELGAVALHLWHRAILRIAARPRRLRPTWPLLALTAVGVAATLGLTHLLMTRLRAYGFLVPMAAVSVVTIAATLVYALTSRRDALRGGVLVLFTVACAAAALAMARAPLWLPVGREILLPSSQVASRLDGWFWQPPRGAVLSIADPKRFDCTPPPASPVVAYPTPSAGPRNVVVLSVDALRSDALDMTHHGRRMMPRVRAFAREAIFAPRAVTTYPATVFAVGSALTGLSASRVLFAPRPPPTVLSLDADPRRERVAILPSSSWFRQPVIDSLFLQGVPARRHRDASLQAADVIRTLAAARARHAPAFVWAHFFEPHEPYQRHRGMDFGRNARARYMSEVAYLDAQLGRIFDWLERSGAYDDTLVVLFADHGEALGERRYYGHHVFLNGFIADVPLAVRAPGAGHRVVHGVTAITDVAATIAHFLGFALDPTASGRSLLAGDPPRDRIAVSEAFPIRGRDLFDLADRPIDSFAHLEERMTRIQASVARYAPKVALVVGHHRLIVDRQTGLRALYDRVADPDEVRNLARVEPRRVARMMARLELWHRRTSEAIYCAARRELAVRPAAPIREAKAPK